ncbi:MAG: ABC transporter ATP-binding protein [Candidatus Heimdallarchaeota archaeon]|nr:ABC transporter ATP-binding protein [Candidatus Heimdallarchaeota archaeon]
MASVELIDVSIRIKGTIVLDRVSLKIEDKEYVALLGPSGAGPSYVLQAIAGTIPIESGIILINEQDVTHLPPEDRFVGFIFERFNLFPHLSVLDNLLFGPRMRREDLEEKEKIAREMLNLVRLNGREDAISRELSGGMQQRVGIARAVTAGAKILLLDQPYRALDAKIRMEMRFEIREIVKELGLMAVHATHDTEEAMLTSDKIAVFNSGKVEQFDLPDIVFNQPQSVFVANFLAESNIFDGSITNSQASFNEVILNSNSDQEGTGKILIRQREVRIHMSSDGLNNYLSGTVVAIRILGEFIRIVVKINESLILTSKELLSLRWKNPSELIGKDVFVNIHPSKIKLFVYSEN